MIAYDCSARDRIVEEYAYLCARGARKFVRPGLERADLEQVAAIGLLKACDRYDARLKTPFEAFAWVFVVGELMHHVRDHERLVRAPRRLGSLERRWRDVCESLTSELQRAPSTLEIAQRLGVSRRDLDDIRQYRERAIAESLDELVPTPPTLTAYTIEQRDDLLVIEQALSRLTKVERTIVLALYGRGYSQFEVAKRLGYSQRHISRLHRSALQKMQPAWVQSSARPGTARRDERSGLTAGG